MPRESRKKTAKSGTAPKKSRPEDLPRVSVIIPIAPGGECDRSIESVKLQNYPAGHIEILVAVGRHRSRQRNAALEIAKGDIIWFMDNDVIIKDQNYLRRNVGYYLDPDVASVGGPSLTPDSDSFFQRSVGHVLGSYFAVQNSRARYRSLGLARDSNEKELILCSQTFRREHLSGGGFDPRLHSGNEENELMNRLEHAGLRMIYDPELVIYRSQRPGLAQFMAQIAKYGKSRMEHFLIKPSALELMFMVPLFFFLYLAAVPFAAWLLPAPLNWISLAPLALYVLIVFVASFRVALRAGSPAFYFSVFALYPVVHISYALGKLYALYRRVVPEKREMPPVKVERIAV